MKTLAVDPGVANVGIAWGSKYLEGCRAFTRPESLRRAPVESVAAHYEMVIRAVLPVRVFDHAIAEHMQAGKGAWEDLVNVQTVGAWLCGRFGRSFQTVTPRAWKNQLPKDVCERRIRAKLLRTEAEAIDRDLAKMPESIHEHAIDAVGIWLFSQGRMKAGR